MATRLNNRLPVYGNPVPDPQAHKVDAMSFSWNGLDAYVFLPWPIIEQALIKLQSHNCLIMTSYAPGDIIVSTLWVTSSVFASCFLLDVSGLEGDLHFIGPIIAAGQRIL